MKLCRAKGFFLHACSSTPLWESSKLRSSYISLLAGFENSFTCHPELPRLSQGSTTTDSKAQGTSYAIDTAVPWLHMLNTRKCTFTHFKPGPWTSSTLTSTVSKDSGNISSDLPS